MKKAICLFILAFVAITLPAFATGPYHSADVNQDNAISLSELLRVIQIFNIGSYYACPGAGTEDGFCVGNPAEGEGEGEGEEAPPTIIEHPKSATVSEGFNKASFTVVATGEDMHYQWYKKEKCKGGEDCEEKSVLEPPIDGATEATFEIQYPLMTDARTYFCVVSNGAGEAISNSAFLTVNACIPQVTQQPQAVNAIAGTIVSFNCQVLGSPPFTYRSYRSKGATIEEIGTQSEPLSQLPLEFGLSATVTLADDGWSYYFTVGNAYGSVETDHAFLSVSDDTDTTPPMINLIGGKAMILNIATPFVDPGWTATDDRDGNLADQVTYAINRYVDGEPQIVDSIDTSGAGEWIIDYQVADTAGNTTTASRHVFVFEDMARTTNVVIVDKPEQGLEALIKVQELGTPFPGMDPAYLTQVGLKYYFTDAAPWFDQDIHPFDGVMVTVDLTKFRPPTLRFEIIGIGLPVDDSHPDGVYFGDILQLSVTYHGQEIPRLPNDEDELAYERSF
ncbi:MAG: immunoglobulin-like domain-containing protein [Candidatus Buchananbacteria bacterium]